MSQQQLVQGFARFDSLRAQRRTQRCTSAGQPTEPDAGSAMHPAPRTAASLATATLAEDGLLMLDAVAQRLRQAVAAQQPGNFGALQGGRPQAGQQHVGQLHAASQPTRADVLLDCLSDLEQLRALLAVPVHPQHRQPDQAVQRNG